MNNIFPDHPTGETLGTLIVERMDGNTRRVMRIVSRDWQALATRCFKISSSNAEKLVDTYLKITRERLKICFIQPTDSEELDRRIQEWGNGLLPTILKVFRGLSQSELEEYTCEPKKTLLKKGQDFSKKNLKKIAHLGARILMDVFFSNQEFPSENIEKDSIAEKVAQQELFEYSMNLIANTKKRIETACSLHPETSQEFESYIKKLHNEHLVEIFNNKLLT